jgi:hypothetical protein
MIDVIFQLATPITTSEPDREFIQTIDGEMRDRASGTIIGRLSASLVQVGRISDAGEGLFDVMDGHSSEMAQYHAAFFKPKGWDYKETIRRQFADILSLDLLVLDRAEIEPPHRKHGLGLLAISRTIDVFGANCALVAMKPFPLQFAQYLDSGWRAPEGVQDPTAEFRIARQKLCRYWERAGFKRVSGTQFWALCPGVGRPSMNYLVAARDETCAADE